MDTTDDIPRTIVATGASYCRLSIYVGLSVAVPGI
jgi:hypothetical protein